MLKYLIADLMTALRFLPVGVLFAAAAGGVLKYGKKNGKFTSVSLNRGVFAILFFSYLFVILCITFFSRESGSRIGFDMRVGSTWGINDRNNAYVVENVLLFVPLGILLPNLAVLFRNVFFGTLAGFLFSTFIEVIQLLTKRGYFQIDDIITNTLGMFIGCVLFTVMQTISAKRKTSVK